MDVKVMMTMRIKIAIKRAGQMKTDYLFLHALDL